MAVKPVVKLKEFLNSNSAGRALIFCIERRDVKSIVSLFPEYKNKPLTLLIGPEGGFSSQEVESIGNLEYAYPVSLGPRILKTETALIASLSYIQLSLT